MGDMADQALERGLCDNYEFRDHVDDLDKYDNVEEHDYVGEGNEIKWILSFYRVSLIKLG